METTITVLAWIGLFTVAGWCVLIGFISFVEIWRQVVKYWNACSELQQITKFYLCLVLDTKSIKLNKHAAASRLYQQFLKLRESDPQIACEFEALLLHKHRFREHLNQNVNF